MTKLKVPPEPGNAERIDISSENWRKPMGDEIARRLGESTSFMLIAWTNEDIAVLGSDADTVEAGAPYALSHVLRAYAKIAQAIGTHDPSDTRH